MTKRENNAEFLDRIMNFGCPTGALIQAFVIDALRRESHRVACSPADLFDSPMLSGEAWKMTGTWLRDEIGKHLAN